jgi:prepilin-type N-terminal cleavage/methylation domain-containing protein
MMKSKPNARPFQSAAGFSLVELLVVVAIIAAMAAVAIPNIGQYIRNFRIKGAEQQVATELNVARSKAIMKNVNLGVVFAVVSPTQYRWVVEDDQQPQTAPNWSGIAGEDWATLTADVAQAGALQSLPANVTFDDPANCGLTGFNTFGLRFTQLGATCSFGAGPCGAAPPSTGTLPTLVRNEATGAHTVCLLEGRTSMRKTVSITPGGRIVAQP